MARPASSPGRFRGSQFTTAMTTTVGMSLTLLLVGLLLALAYLGRSWEEQLRQEARVQVYFQLALEDSVRGAARETLRTDPSVATVRYLDSEEASRELEVELGESFVDFLGYIPLPDVMDITMRPKWSTTEAMAQAVERMENIPGVSEVVWQAELLGQIEETVNRLTIPLSVLALVFLLVAIALINNTIRLTVYARRFIIKTMQLVGAHPASIRAPFIRQGVIYGWISASVAFAGITAMMTVLKIDNAGVMDVFTPTALVALLSVLLLLGTLLGGISTAIAVNRFLRKRVDTLH